MDDDVVFFAMVQRYNIYFKYVSLHHDILGSHGAKSSTENIYWAVIIQFKDSLSPRKEDGTINDTLNADMLPVLLNYSK